MPTAQYLSHSSFLIETGGTKILIDPFFTGNPKAPKDAVGIRRWRRAGASGPPCHAGSPERRAPAAFLHHADTASPTPQIGH